MKERAEIVGAKLRQEDGVGRASDLIFAYLSSAKAAMQPDDTKDENSSKDQDVKSSGRRTILVAAPAKVDIDKEETQLRQGQASPKPLSKASIGTRLISPTGSRRTSSSQSDVQPASAHAEQSERVSALQDHFCSLSDSTWDTALTKKLASRLRGMSLSRGTGSSSSLPKP